MRVIVPGAMGKQGRGALWYLLRQDDVSEIVVGARRIEQVRDLVSRLGDKRLAPQSIDLSDIESTVNVFKGANVVVNCAYEGYPTDKSYMNLEIPATKAALEAGANYTNLGGSPPAPEQLALSDMFQNKGILAVLGMGELTGHLQIMATYAINRIDRTDSIDIKYGERDLVPPEQHNRPIPWGPRPGTKGKTDFAYAGLGATRFRYGSNSASIEEGKLRYDPPRAHPEVFVFKEPIGGATIAQTPGAAAISLSRSFPEIKHISFKAGGDPSFETKVNFLRDLGFFNTKPINVQGMLISPWEVLVALLEQLPLEKNPADIVSEARVIVRGQEAGKEVEYTFSWTRISSDRVREDVVPSSGLCAAIAGLMVARGQAKGTGVLMPEICIPPEKYLDEFVKTGKGEIEISRKMKL